MLHTSRMCLVLSPFTVTHGLLNVIPCAWKMRAAPLTMACLSSLSFSSEAPVALLRSFSPQGLSDLDVSSFCARCVDPMGEESDHVQLVALTDALQVRGSACFTGRAQRAQRGMGAQRAQRCHTTACALGGICFVSNDSSLGVTQARWMPVLLTAPRCRCGWCTWTAAWRPAVAVMATETARCGAR